MSELLAAGIGIGAAILCVLLIVTIGTAVDPRERRSRATRRAYRNAHQRAHETHRNGERLGVDTVTDRDGTMHTRDADGACIACGGHWSDGGEQLFRVPGGFTIL